MKLNRITFIGLILAFFSPLLHATGSTGGGISGSSPGGVSRIVAGDNVTISPSNGLGIVTINGSASGSGTGTTSASTATYGNIYWVDSSSSLALPTQNVYYDVTNNAVSTTAFFGVTYTTYPPSITFSSAGVYAVTLSLSFSGTPSSTFDFALFDQNNIEYNQCHATRKLGTGGDVGAFSATCISTFTAGQRIRVRVKCTNAASTTIVPTDFSLMAHSITGGTADSSALLTSSNSWSGINTYTSSITFQDITGDSVAKFSTTTASAFGIQVTSHGALAINDYNAAGAAAQSSGYGSNYNLTVAAAGVYENNNTNAQGSVLYKSGGSSAFVQDYVSGQSPTGRLSTSLTSFQINTFRASSLVFLTNSVRTFQVESNGLYTNLGQHQGSMARFAVSGGSMAVMGSDSAWVVIGTHTELITPATNYVTLASTRSAPGKPLSLGVMDENGHMSRIGPDMQVTTLTVVSSATFLGGLSISGNGPALFSGNGTSVTLTMGDVAGSSIIVNASGLVVPGFATFVTSFPVELARDWEYLNFSSAVVSFASMTGFGKVVFDGQNSSNTVMTYRLRVPALANPNYNVTLSTFETVSTGTITTADIENYQVSICTRVGGGLTVDASSLVYVSTVNFSITPSVGGTRTMNQVTAPVTLTGWGSLLETGDRDVYIRLVRVDEAKKNSYLLSAILTFIRRW